MMAFCKISTLNCLGIFLLLTEKLVDAQIGPDVQIKPSSLNFLLHVDYETESKSFMAILVSSSYAITSPSYKASYASGTKVYSGDFTNPQATVKHKVTKVSTNGLVSVLTLCPFVTSIENLPVVFNPVTAYQFNENTDADVVFYKRSTKQLFTRTEVVLTDDDCKVDNELSLPGQVASKYQAPNMTCTEYNNMAKGCKHAQQVVNTLSCFPILLLDNKPIGVFRDVICSAGKMDSQTTFSKIMPQVQYLISNSDVEAVDFSEVEEFPEDITEDDEWTEDITEDDEWTEDITEDDDLTEDDDWNEDDDLNEDEDLPEDMPEDYLPEDLPVELPENLYGD